MKAYLQIPNTLTSVTIFSLVINKVGS